MDGGGVVLSGDREGRRVRGCAFAVVRVQEGVTAGNVIQEKFVG